MDIACLLGWRKCAIVAWSSLVPIGASLQVQSHVIMKLTWAGGIGGTQQRGLNPLSINMVQEFKWYGR